MTDMRRVTDKTDQRRLKEKATESDRVPSWIGSAGIIGQLDKWVVWTRHDEQKPVLVGEELVRIHFIIVMIWWTGLAPWEFESLFPGSLTSTFL